MISTLSAGDQLSISLYKVDEHKRFRWVKTLLPDGLWFHLWNTFSFLKVDLKQHDILPRRSMGLHIFRILKTTITYNNNQDWWYLVVF